MAPGIPGSLALERGHGGRNCIRGKQERPYRNGLCSVFTQTEQGSVCNGGSKETEWLSLVACRRSKRSGGLTVSDGDVDLTLKVDLLKSNCKSQTVKVEL